MTGDDTLLLVIASGVARELQDLGRKVFKDGSEINCRSHTIVSTTSDEPTVTARTWCTSTDTLSIIALLQESVDTTHGELKTRLSRAGLRLSGIATSLAG